MEELEALLAKCGFIKRDKTYHDFKSIEELVGFPLPADYTFYLANYEPFGGFIKEEYVDLYGIAEVIEFNSAINLEKTELNTILTGSNGASESIGIRFFGDTYRVIIAQYITDIDDHIIIGTSFTDMLVRLDNGREWFS